MAGDPRLKAGDERRVGLGKAGRGAGIRCSHAERHTLGVSRFVSAASTPSFATSGKFLMATYIRKGEPR